MVVIASDYLIIVVMYGSLIMLRSF
jgi:hypothetical protein